MTVSVMSDMGPIGPILTVYQGNLSDSDDVLLEEKSSGRSSIVGICFNSGTMILYHITQYRGPP